MSTSTQFASRAGEKLAHALTHFPVDPKDKICADLGCSTGGFTDVLLQHGAEKVYAVDTAKGVIAWKLRTDPRVILMEGTNALHVTFPELVDIITIDVGWTPQRLIIPHALTLLKEDGHIISLLKPHYEAPKHLLRKGHLPEEHLDDVIALVRTELRSQNITIRDIVKSPLVGGKGKNIEYLIWLSKKI